MITFFTIWSCILSCIGIATFTAGMISFQQAKKSFKKAISLHEEVKTLLNDCQNTRDQSFQYMEAGRAYWVMAQMQSESEDWK